MIITNREGSSKTKKKKTVETVKKATKEKRKNKT